MPLIAQRPMNPLLGAPTAQSATNDLLGMASPIGMAYEGVASGGGHLRRIVADLLARKRAAHQARLVAEMAPEALGGVSQVARPASPPNFTPPEVERMRSVIGRWLQQVSPEEEDQMMRRWVYPNQ